MVVDVLQEVRFHNNFVEYICHTYRNGSINSLNGR
jgi:hypothetical protein